jgi:protease-4
MATRTQGLLLGCLFAVGAGVLLLFAASLLFRGPGIGGGLSLGGEDKVGLVILQGPIIESRNLVDEIEANRRDQSVKAVVFRVNSPGGEVAPSQEIYEALLRLGEEKPVVASLGSVAASGAFYAAVAADTIVADPGSVVGSIGVIFMYPTARELMEKVGIELQVYKSGRLKDMGSFSRDPTEEEEEVFDSIIADVYDQFLTAVSDRRQMDREVTAALGDGRIFSGRQALEVGLIDGVGDLHRAINIAAGMAGLPPEPPVERKARARIPLFEVLDQLFRDGTRAAWGPRLEYRLR